MSDSTRYPNKRRFLLRASLPFGLAAGSIVAAFGYPAIVSASTPSLPAISASGLIAMALHPTKPLYSATVEETGNLGIPSAALGSLQSSSSSPLSDLLTQALTGTVSLSFWQNGAHSLRVQVPSAKGESDLYYSKGALWSWDSTTNTATKINLSGNRNSLTSTSDSKSKLAGHSMPKPGMTPGEFASKFLSNLPSGSTTSVTTAQYVANQPAYTLNINTNDPKSLLRSVSLAVDANTGQTLGVWLYSSASSPALSISYQNVSYGVPSPSVFAFTPPSAATVKTVSKSLPSGKKNLGTKTSTQNTSSVTHKTLGSGFSSVELIIPNSSNAAQKINSTVASILNTAGTRVTTTYGPGTVVSTNLVSVFIGSNGTIAVGAVPSAVLLADLG